MNNLTYIFSGSQLFRVMNTYKNKIEVVPTTEHLSKKIAKRTYAINQLETLGYVIVQESSRCLI